MTAPSSRTLPPGLEVCRACHCLAARKRARAITRLYEERLGPDGLRATQYSILAVLALKGTTRLGELADLLGLERTSLTRSAGVVERNGWIASGESDDGRERPLRITENGLEKLLAAFPAWKEAQEMVDRGWPDDPSSNPVGAPGVTKAPARALTTSHPGPSSTRAARP